MSVVIIKCCVNMILWFQDELLENEFEFGSGFGVNCNYGGSFWMQYIRWIFIFLKIQLQIKLGIGIKVSFGEGQWSFFNIRDIDIG